MNIVLTDFILLIPEILLILSAILSQGTALFTNRKSKGYPVILAGLFLIYAMLYQADYLVGEGFSHTYKSNKMLLMFKLLVIISLITTIIIHTAFIHFSLKEYNTTEFITLVTFASSGLMFMLSAKNFMLLYLGLELYTICTYILIVFDKNNPKSSEAGLKYFVLGALSSGIMLFGISLLYGFAGTIDFSILKHLYSNRTFLTTMPDGVTIGITMIIVGILFKLSAAPFHFWAPDVYEGSFITTVLFFITASKIGIVSILINIIYTIFSYNKHSFLPSLEVAAVLSIIVGAFGAIMQTSVKRLLAYSTILNIGYILAAFSAASILAIKATLIHLIIYIISTLGFLTILIQVFGKDVDNILIEDLSGLAKSQKYASFVMLILIFSMVGIPPVAGFFGKFYIFSTLIDAKLYTLLIASILGSIISAFYYLKIIKFIYFNKPNVSTSNNSLPFSINIITATCSIIILSYSILPNILPNFIMHQLYYLT